MSSDTADPNTTSTWCNCSALNIFETFVSELLFTPFIYMADILVLDIVPAPFQDILEAAYPFVALVDIRPLAVNATGV